jgi:hypothetical protein
MARRYQSLASRAGPKVGQKPFTWETEQSEKLLSNVPLQLTRNYISQMQSDGNTVQRLLAMPPGSLLFVAHQPRSRVGGSEGATRKDVTCHLQDIGAFRRVGVFVIYVVFV